MPEFSLEPEEERPRRWIRLADGRFYAKQVDVDEPVTGALREIPHRWYDENRKRWIVPPVPESAHALLTLHKAHPFSIEDGDRDELQRIASLHESIRRYRKLAAHGRYIFRSPGQDDTLIYVPLPRDAVAAAALKDVAGAVWDERIGALRIQAAGKLADTILDLADQYSFYVEPAEHSRLIDATASLFDEDEFAYNPVISEDRMLYRLLVQMREDRREALFEAVRSYRSF